MPSATLAAVAPISSRYFFSTRLFRLAPRDENIAVRANRLLFEKGVYVESFRWPAVPEGAARMRIVPMAHHEQKHLDKLIKALEETGKELKI